MASSERAIHLVTGIESRPYERVRQWILSVYLDAYNATNRTNAEGSSDSFDYSRRTLTRGLPIIPSFGLRGSY